MKVVIAPDSFKGSLTAKQAGEAIERGLKKVLADGSFMVVPMADGGEGTLQCLLDATQGRKLQAIVKDPLGRDIVADYGILGDGQTCMIELAAASGLYLLEPQERNPAITTTYGFGQLIKAGLDQGCRHFLLGLGGSATNDGGAGMLQALGYALLGEAGQPIGWGGGQLHKLREIRREECDPRLAECRFIIACDVTNPLIGAKGASFVFGPQKGADRTMCERLDQNLTHFADVIQRTTGVAIHHLPGAGAAGGIAGALLALLDGKLQSGIDLVIQATGLERLLPGSDLVITGEGQVDGQTAQGKTPLGVAKLAQRYKIPTIVLAGSVGQGIDSLYQHGVQAVVSIVNRPMTLEVAMADAAALVESAAEQVMRIYTGGRSVSQLGKTDQRYQ
ncbi:glycerate kinase [Brevibacillus fulvus]|uniref:Glycerate kinase n=1 Tax=Brevibacillus fulvus TaxID=1125967 RepID=A0A939BU66_9BACL|nr:glycerate kinase [Brevibacillus fulvus]MBM7589201.1 glycerate kinase [Brevibacillus fulvus]